MGGEGRKFVMITSRFIKSPSLEWTQVTCPFITKQCRKRVTIYVAKLQVTGYWYFIPIKIVTDTLSPFAMTLLSQDRKCVAVAAVVTTTTTESAT